MKTSEKKEATLGTLPVSHTPAERWSLVESNNEAYLRIFSGKNINMTYTLTNSRDELVFPGGRAEAKANARVIAMAARLLHACKVAAHQLDQIYMVRIPTTEDEQILDMLEYIIKLAEKS